MKRKFTYTLIICFILFFSFSVIKWDELKYYFFNANTEIKINNTVYDFGNISSKDTIQHSFWIKNIGKNELKFKNVIPSCSCTIIDFDKKKVSSNDSIELKIKFIPKDTGKTEKSIVVDVNTAPPFHVLYIKGNVKKIF